MLETLKPLPPDAILGIMTLFRADPHAGKIDLSVGVYQDERGHTPVLASVKRAEKTIIDAQDTKTYVAIAGNAGLQQRRRGAALRRESSRAQSGRVCTVQTPGGSGGLSVAGHLLSRAKPNAKIYLSDPSWPNHLPLLKTAGLTLDTYPYYDFKKHRVDFDAMLRSSRRSRPASSC